MTRPCKRAIASCAAILPVVMFSVAMLVASAAIARVQATDAAESAADDEIGRLIEQLGDPQFAVRQRAQQRLMKLGFEAFDALAEAEQSDDPEVALQAGYLVRQIRTSWTRDTDPRQIQQILKDYEIQSDERRLDKIRQLAALPDDTGLKWLCRLVRFERSPVVSKQAALAVMNHEPRDEAAWELRAETIRDELQRARRPAAKWLEVDLQAHRDPEGAIDRWSALVADELDTLEQHPQETHNQIVSELLRRQVALLDRLGRSNETGEVLRQLVLCERGDSDSLAALVDWLVERQAWDTVDLVAERFAASIEADAVLMYTFCEARLAQGDRKLAEALAEKALQIHGDSQQDHVLLATRLSDRGLPTWAEHEWRHAISLGPSGTPSDVIARKLLANSYHDRQRDFEAGEVIQQLIEAAESDVRVMQRLRTAQQQIEAGINGLRSDMYYYQACHAASEGDAARQRTLLDKSLEQNQANVEALIALYEITADDPKKRAQIAEWSKEFIELCRGQIDDDQENPTYYNQIAWLVANTEGNFDEAVMLSHKSIELARAAGDPPTRLGGLLDTLAHCYYAKKDYAAAVKYQEEAALLDPHTQSIRRALARFRAALEHQQDVAE